MSTRGHPRSPARRGDGGSPGDGARRGAARSAGRCLGGILPRALVSAALLAGLALAANEAGRATAQPRPTEADAAWLLDATNQRINTDTTPLAISREVTNDASLPRGAGSAQDDWRGESPRDPTNFRVAMRAAQPEVRSAGVVVETLDPASGALRGRLEVRLTRASPEVELRSPFLRLVADEVDARAPGVADRVLRAGLGDELRVRSDDRVLLRARVGAAAGLGLRPPARDGVALRGRLRVRVLRLWPGGPPSIGRDEAHALALARAQVAAASEAWAQCGVTFGDGRDADVALADPPPAWIVAIGDGAGLPATGGGTLRVAAEGRIVSISIQPGATPVETALALAEALVRAGFRVTVIENAPTERGAGRSADVLVRTPDGVPVALAAPPGEPLSTDARQPARLGGVDLADGLLEFDNDAAAVGTLEERALVHAVADADPATIDVLVVPRFSRGTRQGEAFVRAEGGALAGVVLLDRNGVRQHRQAYTLAHELGHVLLDQPYHPDNLAGGGPHLLMHSEASGDGVTGPKRLTAEQCAVARERGAVRAVPPLLAPVTGDPLGAAASGVNLAPASTAEPPPPARAGPFNRARRGPARAPRRATRPRARRARRARRP